MAYASCARSSAVSVTSCRPAARRRAARSADMPMAGPGPGTALMVAPSQLEARVAEGWTLVDIRDERQHANARLKAAAHVPLFVADESQGASVLGRKVRQRGWVGGLRTHARARARTPARRPAPSLRRRKGVCSKPASKPPVGRPPRVRRCAGKESPRCTSAANPARGAVCASAGDGAAALALRNSRVSPAAVLMWLLPGVPSRCRRWQAAR